MCLIDISYSTYLFIFSFFLLSFKKKEKEYLDHKPSFSYQRSRLLTRSVFLVTIHLKALPNTPSLKQPRFKCDASQNFEYVVRFLRRRLKVRYIFFFFPTFLLPRHISPPFSSVLSFSVPFFSTPIFVELGGGSRKGRRGKEIRSDN